MRYEGYRQWLQTEYPKINLELGSIEVGPFLAPTSSNPNRPPWQMEWCVRFTDGKYFRVRENWSPQKKPHNLDGVRGDFAFHYGCTNPRLDGQGIPYRDNANYPAILRIDRDFRGPHIHYDGEDHIFQPRVKNFTIEGADIFAFVRAIQEHRITKNPLHTILGFEVVP